MTATRKERISPKRSAAVDVELDTEARWYIIHAYSGQEERVKRNLEQRTESLDMQDKIFEVSIPTEEEVEIRDGRRQSVQKKVFPGYLLVHMQIDSKSWQVVRNTPGVTGFVSVEDDRTGQLKPVPLEPDELEAILKRTEAPTPAVRVGFEVGQSIRITEGPFADFIGKVGEIFPDKGKVQVRVSFFGRETPVALDFRQVEKF